MNKFDKLLKEKLSAHESPYSGKVWDGIEASLHPKKSNKGFIFFLVLTGLLISVVSILIYLNTTATSKDLSTSPANESNQYSETITDNYDLISADNKDLIESEKIKEPYTLDNGSTNQSKPINLSTENIISNELQVNDKTIKTGFNDSINNQASVKNNFINSQILTKNVDVLENAVTNTASNSIKSTQQNQKAFDIVKELSPLKSLDGIGLAALEYNIEREDLAFEIVEHNEKTCPRFSVFRPGLYFDINYSIDYAIKSISSKNIDFANYAYQRNETESYSYSYSFSARVSYVDPSGFTAKGGLSYSEINEELNYIDPEKQNFKTIIEIDSTFNGTEWVIDRDTTITPVPGTGLIQRKNRYKTINIPLSLAYEWRYNRRFSFFLEGGVQFNILFNKRGEILSPYEDNKVVNFSEDSDSDIDVFNKRFSTGFMFNTGAIYHLNHVMDVYASTGFRHHPGSLTVDSYPVQQKFSVFNIATGIRYKF